MTEIETTSGQEAIRTHCLTLRFFWVGDHWKHELVSTGDSASLPLVWSVEGGASAQEPTRVVSPTYQQIDRAGDVARALLVGQSGPHHFSASFEVEEHSGGVSIAVDVADRCLGPVEALAATYQVEASAGQLDFDDGVILELRHPSARLRFQAEPPAQALADEAGMGVVRLQALAGLDPNSRTHRLRYRWIWEHARDSPVGNRQA
jgi:hypothetical protein